MSSASVVVGSGKIVASMEWVAWSTIDLEYFADVDWSSTAIPINVVVVESCVCTG